MEVDRDGNYVPFCTFFNFRSCACMLILRINKFLKIIILKDVDRC